MMQNAVAAMAAWKGPVFEERAPLNPQNQQNPEESLRYAADYHLQDAYYMPNGNYFDLGLGIGCIYRYGNYQADAYE